MKTRLLIIGLLIFGIISITFGYVQKNGQTQKHNQLPVNFLEPLFVTQARGESSWIGELLDNEAGISAWFEGDVINLDNVRDTFRVIEYETSEYIIGSVPVPLYESTELEDAHVYVSIYGWVLAYYPNDSVSSRMVDVRYYDIYDILTTKLHRVLELIASEGLIPLPDIYCYDFRYPNATNAMISIDSDFDGDWTYTIELPSTYIYYERSWFLRDVVGWQGPGFWLNGIQLGACWESDCYGSITPSQLPPDTLNTVVVRDIGGIVLIYEEP